MSRKIYLTVALAAVALVVTGCSKDEGSSGGGQAQGGDGAAVESPTTISGGDTTVDIGGGSLPEGFPDAFPLPDGAAPVNSVSGAGGFFVWFSSGQSVDDLRTFFDDSLSGGGWKITSKADFGDSTGQYTAYTIQGNGYGGVVYIGAGAPGADAFGGQYQFYVQLSPA